MLDAEPIRELAAGATHIVHCAAIAGVDTVIESPVRTMRVNVIGTYNVLEAALATKDTLERLIEFSTSEVFGTYAFKVAERRRDHAGLGGRGALDVRGLEARRRAHGSRLPRRARAADDLGAARSTSSGPARSAAARSAPSSRPRSPGATSSSTATARRSAPGATSTTWSRACSLCLERPEAVGQSFNIGNAALGGDDLRPRHADPAADRLPGRDPLPAAALHRRRAAHPERRQGPRAARLRGARSSSTTASRGRSRGIGAGSRRVA